MSTTEACEGMNLRSGQSSQSHCGIHETVADICFMPDRKDNSDEVRTLTWGKKTVLSFDGGGVRGYSSLLILKNLMLEVREIELKESEGRVRSSRDYDWMDHALSRSSTAQVKGRDLDAFLPCHYFDYMAGTSTGGLSAIMLGRLRMSVDEAIDQYRNFGNAVFGKPRWFHERSVLYWGRAKFASRKARGAFKHIIYAKLHRERGAVTEYRAEDEPFADREDRTRTIVFSFCIQKGAKFDSPWLWRSYDHQSPPDGQGTYTDGDRSPTQFGLPLNPSPAHRTPIWQVARATSAAPRYFESIKIDGCKHLDGGMCCNNPSSNTLREIRRKHGYAPRVFVSIGTGKKSDSTNNRGTQNSCTNQHDFGRTTTIDDVRRKQFLKKYLEIGRHWQNFMTDTEGDNGANGWASDCHAAGVEVYRRLNVEGNLSAEIVLDDWRPANTGARTLGKIEEETREYLDQQATKDMISRIARELVDIRRARARTERWEEFATDVCYHCPIEDCKAAQTTYQTRNDLRQHFRRLHQSITKSDREDRLSEGRRMNCRN